MKLRNFIGAAIFVICILGINSINNERSFLGFICNVPLRSRTNRVYLLLGNIIFYCIRSLLHCTFFFIWNRNRTRKMVFPQFLTLFFTEYFWNVSKRTTLTQFLKKILFCKKIRKRFVYYVNLKILEIFFL